MYVGILKGEYPLKISIFAVVGPLLDSGKVELGGAGTWEWNYLKLDDLGCHRLSP